MRKLTLIGLMVVLCVGCGRSWLPLRGASCRGGCGQTPPAPQLPACSPCSNTSGYAAYESEMATGDSYYGGVVDGEYYDGAIIDGGYSNGTIVNPPMAPIAPAT
jgi:hypothetical protein